MGEELEKDMTPRLVKDLGMGYFTEKSKYKTKLGIYECQYCTKEFVGHTYHINSGSAKSCGCQYHNPREKSIKHNLSNHKFYSTWTHMLHRCSNPNNKGYKYYGGRGITVCEEWLDVRNFVAWCDLTHPNIEGYTLDRIDVNGNYEPSNCRWADASTQCINQRIQKNNTSGFTGITKKKHGKSWLAQIRILNINKHIGSFPTIEEAVQARDNYIIQNNLPHKLSTDYKREDS